jgi:stage V sporulation protein R
MSEEKQYLITSKTDWTPELIYEVWGHIKDIADNDLKVTYYQPQIEIISAEQMLDCYASVGLPVMYNHWSYGKGFLEDFKQYMEGKMGLAYEIVINSDPCVSYLMEENNMLMQTLVMAHAAVGHSAVFKNNYMFKDWTSAGSIIDFMVAAKDYIRDCEDKFGVDEVEKVLDAAHALASHGVDKSKRKHKPKLDDAQRLQKAREKLADEAAHFDIIMKKTRIEHPDTEDKDKDLDQDDLVGSEENLLYFIYKKAPNLPQWKREILRIVYKINQYFYPQSQTKVLNEGFATFTHYYIMNKLEERGIISPDAQISWLANHSGVLYQPETSQQFNPYALGFAILMDVKRICEGGEFVQKNGKQEWVPITDEDREWFPNLIGKDWRVAVQEAAFEYRDESFIQQFLSPHLIRKWRFWALEVDLEESKGIVTEVSDEQGYKNIRDRLALYYNRINYVPDISVYSATMKQDRELTLEYKPFLERELYEPYMIKTMKYVRELWGYPVQMIEQLRDPDTGEVIETDLLFALD